MSVTITQWGNSAALRIPAEQMRKAGLNRGDRVIVEVNERGNLEVMPQTAHRIGRRRRIVTFHDMFDGYTGGRLDVGDPWNDDSYVGEEQVAWT